MSLFHKIASSRAWKLGILGALLLIIGIVWFSLQYAGNARKITKIQIEIKPDSGIYFVTQNDISAIISKTSGNPVGKSVNELNLAQMEGRLRKIPCVEKAQVFASLDGKLKISIRQRIPVLRIYNAFFETYFLDSSGAKIPLTPGNATPDVLVANGNIQEKLADSSKIHTPILRELLAVAKFISKDPFWDAQFEQCYVDNFGDIILVPRAGKHSIVVGSSENLPEKMENLRVFYEKGLRNLGWDTYSIINLKYQGQVVATRNGKQTEHKPKEDVQNTQH